MIWGMTKMAIVVLCLSLKCVIAKTQNDQDALPSHSSKPSHRSSLKTVPENEMKTSLQSTPYETETASHTQSKSLFTRIFQPLDQQSEETIAKGFTFLRAFYSIGVSNAIYRRITSEQLKYATNTPPAYQRSFINFFRDTYAGSIPRALWLMTNNAFTSFIYTFGHNHNPLSLSALMTVYGAAVTPIEYMITRKTDSVCLWREGKLEKPVSYTSILMKDFGKPMFKGSMANGAAYGISWFAFLHFVPFFLERTDETGINAKSLIFYSGLCSVIETATYTPFFNILRHQQMSSTPSYPFYQSVKDMWKSGGIKNFSQSWRLVFVANFLSSFLDLSYLRYIRDRHVKKT